MDIPWVVATGGSKGEMAIWDLSESQIIEKHFKGQIVEGSYQKTDYDPSNPGNDVQMEQQEEDDQFEDVSSDESVEKPKKKKKKKSKA